MYAQVVARKYAIDLCKAKDVIIETEKRSNFTNECIWCNIIYLRSTRLVQENAILSAYNWVTDVFSELQIPLLETYQ